MPKQRYTPPNDEVAAEIKHVVELHQAWKKAETDYKQALTKVTDPEGLDVPVSYMAAQLGVERKTVYRHRGQPMS